MKILDFLTKPHFMPFYAFLAFFGIECSMFFVEFWLKIIYCLFVLLSTAFVPYFIDKLKRSEKFAIRITYQFLICILYLFLFAFLNICEFSLGKVSRLIPVAYFLVFLVSFFEKKFLSFNCISIGALSGFIFCIGYATKSDIFVSFVSSLIFFSIRAFVDLNNKENPIAYRYSSVSYLIGLALGLLCLIWA